MSVVRVAAIILNRNLPEAPARIRKSLFGSESVELETFVIESGSDEQKLSHGYTWWANSPDSMASGLRYPRGFNYGLLRLKEAGKLECFDYFFLLCNDVEFVSRDVVTPLVRLMEAHPRLGILSPCSTEWGEHRILGADGIKYFWQFNHLAVMIRKEFLLAICERDSPTEENFFYDGTNFRGYDGDTELIAKGYMNDFAAGMTSEVMMLENREYLLTKADLIKTDPLEESLKLCLAEGMRWMRRKYGFNSRWRMQQYARFAYDAFFEMYPELMRFSVVPGSSK